MKKVINIIILLLGMIFTFPSCDRTDSISEEYRVPNGRSYPAKALNVQACPGDERIEIVWINGSDPKVEKARISWNNYTEWEEINITVDMDTIRKEIKPLDEMTYSFMIRTYDAKGNISVPVEVIGRVYGEKYKSTLVSRTLKDALYVSDKGSLQMEWYEAEITEVGMELEYTDINGDIRTMLLASEETSATITDMKEGTPVYYTSMFKPDSMAIDVFRAPKVQAPYKLPDINITAQVLENTSHPFITGAQVRDWYCEAAGWSVSPNLAPFGAVYIYENVNYLNLSIDIWDNATSLTNAKLYQTVELPAGKYRFSIFGYTGWVYPSSTGIAYASIALGNELPNTDDVEYNSLAFAQFNFINEWINDVINLDFTLDIDSTVSLGFVGNFYNAQLAFRNKFELWRLSNE